MLLECDDPDYFCCENGEKKIPWYWKCDSDEDCADKSDEGCCKYGNLLYFYIDIECKYTKIDEINAVE